ncbi:MAG TPA: hypothetical protein VG796_18170 [Verrucomicrobiales bacterium]|nr:hypothetical protein [Verrucomicrobiales bacterium]
MRSKYIPWLVALVASGIAFLAGRHWAPNRMETEKEPVTAAHFGKGVTKAASLPAESDSSSASVAPPVTRDEESHSPPERVRMALTEPNPFRRMQLFYRALTSLTPEQAKEIAKIFQESERQGLSFASEFAFFTRRWGEVDGAAAMAFAEKRRTGKSNMGEAVTLIAGGWASQQPQQAVDWLNAHLDADPLMLDAATVGLVDGLAEKDMDLARRFVEERLDDPHSEKYLTQLTDKFIHSEGMEKAEAWFDSLPAGKLGLAKTNMLTQLTERHLRAGPEQAAAFVSRYAQEPWFGQVAAIKVAQEYYRTDPVKADAWIDTMPEAARSTLRGFRQVTR